MRKSALFLLALVVAGLVALGLVVLFNASQPNSLRHTKHVSAYFFFNRQLIHVGIGIFAAIVTALVDYHIWRKHPWLVCLMYITGFILLLLVFRWFGGTQINGSYRWIDLGVANIQPSELAKIAIVIAVAAWIDSLSWDVSTFKLGALVPFMMIAGYCVPILMETDLGSTLIVGGAGLLVMFLGGTKLIHLLFPTIIGLCGFLAVMFTNENRMRRLAGWLPPNICDFLGLEHAVESVSGVSEMSASEYQVYNSLVAIANGGVGGVGLTNSMQKEYYLPEAHTDFVLAIGAEEMGVLFTVGVILLFVLFFVFSLYIARTAMDRFGRLIATGMAFIIFVQAMANIGVVSEALPTKGIALPFFSYGGTNIICALASVGIILSVGIRSLKNRKRMARPNALK